MSILACNGFFILCNGQNNPADSIFLSQSINNAIAVQRQGLAENLRLYNGSAYTYSYSGAKGFPYFLSDTMVNGDLHYDGSFYKSIPMFFDLLTGDVIISSFKGDHNIQLVREKFSQFDVAGHRFLFLKKDSTHGAVIETGFYELSYSGKTGAYVKREKKLRQIAKAEGIDAQFIDFNYYYLKREGMFYSITNKASLLEAFGAKKNDVKKYLNKNHFNFKKHPEETLIIAARYYDQVTTN